MGWSVGLSDGRWIGYGVPAICDQPDCGASIDRGLSYLCGDGDKGCGLFFCYEHVTIATSDGDPQMCERCDDEKPPFEPTADTPEWIEHMLHDESWEQWRNENPDQVALMGPTTSIEKEA